MGRLIDIDEAYKVLTDYYHHRTEIQHKALKEAIERVPIADIDAIIESHERTGYDRGFRDGYAQAISEVRHGHWVQGKESSRCSECNCTLAGQALWKYCPICGAKMDRKGKENGI